MQLLCQRLRAVAICGPYVLLSSPFKSMFLLKLEPPDSLQWLSHLK